MKWKAHTRTAEKIISAFGAMYFEKYEKDLINGIISPDNRDEKIHYIGREQNALDYFLRARKSRLEYDTSTCFFQMGVGFHYIQDMWTGISPDESDHGLYLDLINKCDILDIHVSLERFYPVRRKRVLEQFRALENRLGKSIESEKKLKELVLLRRPYESSAVLDLNLSFRVCYRIAEMILKTMYNVRLQESLELLNKEYEEKIFNREAEELEYIELLVNRVSEANTKDSAIHKLNKWNLERKLDSVKKDHSNRKHLQQLIKEYNSRILVLCKPLENWYNIDKPVIDLDKILAPRKEENLSIDEEKESYKLIPEIK